MKRVLVCLASLVAVALLAGVAPSLAAASDAETEACANVVVEDLTPEVTARLAKADVVETGPAQTSFYKDGMRISRAWIEARDSDGARLLRGSMTCSSSCIGPGTCTGTGCVPDGMQCSSFTCTGNQCVGSCTKTIVVER